MAAADRPGVAAVAHEAFSASPLAADADKSVDAHDAQGSLQAVASALR